MNNFAIFAAAVALLPWLSVAVAIVAVCAASYHALRDDQEQDETPAAPEMITRQTPPAAAVEILSRRVAARMEADATRTDWHRKAEGPLVDLDLSEVLR